MFFLDRRRTRTTYDPNDLEPPRVVKLLALAERFQILVSTGQVRTQSDIAKHEGLTRAQIMNLLKLHPAILDYIRELPNEAPRNWVTEKKLRRLTGLEPKEQLRVAEGVLRGFGRKGRRSAKSRAIPRDPRRVAEPRSLTDINVE